MSFGNACCSRPRQRKVSQLGPVQGQHKAQYSEKCVSFKDTYVDILAGVMYVYVYFTAFGRELWYPYNDNLGHCSPVKITSKPKKMLPAYFNPKNMLWYNKEAMLGMSSQTYQLNLTAAAHEHCVNGKSQVLAPVPLDLGYDIKWCITMALIPNFQFFH